MEYEKKDIKKAPKVKKGVYKVEGGYAFWDKKNDVEYTFEKDVIVIRKKIVNQFLKIIRVNIKALTN